ncbi:MAG: proline--tRNA ligase [Buchnera aphidicola (Chaetogeoica yunlongensis)]
MRAKKYLFSTLKETPHNSDCISHTLMIRAGIIRQNSSGTYIWLPTGIKILKKITNIIKKEMNQCGAMEISMPFLQKKDLWKISGRLKTYGKELFHILDRQNKEFVLGPTHEEIITCFMRNELKSYKQLPITLYQIQTKFRDEIRPRFGIIRTKEFLMKDAYSFHLNSNSLKITYNKIYKIYKKIFKQMQLKFHVVAADSGLMGGKISHEFQAPAIHGENTIVHSTQSNYAANLQSATSTKNKSTTKNLITYDLNSIIKIINTQENTLTKLSNTPNSLNNNFVKTILVKANKNSNYSFLALLIRGDYSINEYKLSKIKEIFIPITFASNEQILKITGSKKKFISPINLKIPIIADFSVMNLKNFTIGSNIENQYFNHMNWHKNISKPKMFYDIRYVTHGDPSPDGKGTLVLRNSIEIAHIFQLGKTYSKTMNMQIQDTTGDKKNITMGCYGIGITRILAAIIEQNHDQYGIIFPKNISPFQIAIIPINFYKSKLVKKNSKNIYYFCKKNNIEVILDDREKSFGEIISEIELIGIPHSIIISEKLLRNNIVEYRTRCDNSKKFFNINNILKIILETCLHK